MEKNSPIVIILLVLALLLSGCSSAAAGGSSTAVQQGVATSTAATLKDRLAVGILKLEGTDLAVTPEQAKELLPLWKAIQSLGSSDTTSQLEIDAVYQQIQDALTADQLASIEALDLSGENMQTLMSDLGIDMAAQNAAGMTDEERATRVAELQSANNMPSFGGGGGGAPSGSGGAMPSGGEMPSGGDIPSGGEMPSGGDMGMMFGDMQTTPQPGQAAGGLNMSSFFIDPLIELLKTRAAE